MSDEHNLQVRRWYGVLYTQIVRRLTNSPQCPAAFELSLITAWKVTRELPKHRISACCFRKKSKLLAPAKSRGKINHAEICKKFLKFNPKRYMRTAQPTPNKPLRTAQDQFSPIYIAVYRTSPISEFSCCRKLTIKCKISFKNITCTLLVLSDETQTVQDLT